MSKTPLWKSISNQVHEEIAAGHFAPGDKLPTEAELAKRFGVNRHTIRHALSALVENGHVFSRRGSGFFVTHLSTNYAIGRRVRFHQNLEAEGRVPGKSVLSLTTRPADVEERDTLGLNSGEMVHAYHGLSTADDVPIAVFVSVFPAQRLPNLEQELQHSSSVTAALRAHGISDYTRLHTKLTACSADATQALHLRIREGAPLLMSVGINIDPDGQPIEFGKSWFAGDRVTLTLGN